MAFHLLLSDMSHTRGALLVFLGLYRQWLVLMESFLKIT